MIVEFFKIYQNIEFQFYDKFMCNRWKENFRYNLL